MNIIEQCLFDIRKYTEENKELKRAHHFLFCLPHTDVDGVKQTIHENDEIILFIGKNPGEVNDDWYRIPKSLNNETREHFIKIYNEVGNNKNDFSRVLRDEIFKYNGMENSYLVSDSELDYGKPLERYPLEETNDFDFHDDNDPSAWLSRSKIKPRNSIRWTERISKICGNSKVIQSELFFWSSNNTDNAFESKFGYKFKENNPHLKFCTKQNKLLMRFYNTKLVIYNGLGEEKELIDQFNLVNKSITYRKKTSSKRLAVGYIDESDRPFLILDHITGARGQTELDRDNMKILVSRIKENNYKLISSEEFDSIKL